MKNAILIIGICILCKFSFGQSSISQRNDLIKDKVIYLTFESGKLKYFTTGNFAGREPLKSNHTFALKGNFSNIYFSWFNPLKYNITWKDTSYADDRDKAVNDFVKLFVGQFDSSVSDLKSSDRKKMLAQLPSREDTEHNKTRLYGTDPNDSFDGFNNLDLMQLYLRLRDGEVNLKDEEIVQLNSILKELDLLDNLNYTKISDEADEQFVKLFEIEKCDDVSPELTEAKDNLSGWEAIFKIIEDSQAKVMVLVRDLKITSDPILQLYTKSVISNFSNDITNNLKSNKIIVSKIKPCFDIIEKSVKNELTTQKGYFLNRDVSFDNGKVEETEITITEFEYKKDSKEFAKKSTVYSSKMKFKEYDWVVPVVSAGVFYSNATLNAFGVATDSSGKMTVTEDNIKKNTAVTCLFLNLNFDIGSRFIAPAIQLGIDPTKKRPYVLLGGGLAIPVARIALTGGGIWTWDAYLDGLQVGQSIKTTTDLEKATKNKFNIVPKGWYIGIQYNF